LPRTWLSGDSAPGGQARTRSSSPTAAESRGQGRPTRTGADGSTCRPLRRQASRPPYDLRHSFLSLLIAEGQNVVDIARQAGHSPNDGAHTYAHVFEEFDPAERMSAADRIRQARDEVRFAAMQPRLFDVA
jgi:integrase